MDCGSGAWIKYIRVLFILKQFCYSVSSVILCVPGSLFSNHLPSHLRNEQQPLAHSLLVPINRS